MRGRWLAFLLALLLLAGCARTERPVLFARPGLVRNVPHVHVVREDLEPVRLILNWHAQAELGGLYAAQALGYFEPHGIRATILPGGPGIDPIAAVAEGAADFGVANAENILAARDQGIPVVALLAPFQVSPRAIAYHDQAGITGFSDLRLRTVWAAPGAWWDHLVRRYGLETAPRYWAPFSMDAFLQDRNSVMQVYITSEPLELALRGARVRYLLVADTGFNPYGNVLFTTEDTIRQRPHLVREFVTASVDGWLAYLQGDHGRADELILRHNHRMTRAQLEFSRRAMGFLIFAEEGKARFGMMTLERWTQLYRTMNGQGLLRQEWDPSAAFTIEFLP